jgi:hypothetical protein
MRIWILLMTSTLLLSCSSTDTKPATAKIRESHFADDNTMLIFSLGSAAGIPATSPAKDLRARAAKNAKDGALGRALEICRNADPRVYLMECKPGAPKIVVSEETQVMQKTLNAAKKLVAESCEGEGAAIMCEADYEIRLPGLRKQCIEFAQRKACADI